MSKIGRLDRRIQFRRFTLVDDGFSQVETWVDHGTLVWAQKTDVSDGERWRASEVQAQVTTRFLVRWSAFAADITPKDRIVCDGLEYNIAGVKEGDGRRQWLEITAAARTDQ